MTQYVAAAVVIAILSVVSAAQAQIAVSANDNKVQLVNGAVKVLSNPPSDTVSVIDRKSTRLNSSHIQKSRMPSSA